MWEDEILEQIHRIREEHAKSFDYDMKAICEDWRKRQAESGREVVNLSAKKEIAKRWSKESKDSQ
jgi:hypothetical protein